MITIEERITQKVVGETSLFIKFDFNQELVNIIKLYSGCSYSKKTKEWEVPLTYLSRFLDAASKFDQISLKLLKDSKEKSPQRHEIGPFKVKPFDHQLEAIQYGLNHDRWLLLDLPGLGKAFELDTPVLTPDGYIPIRDVEVGDTLYNERGEKTTVQAVYDHLDLEMYEVTFEGGTSLICCKDHLWRIMTSEGWSTQTTKQIETLISKTDIWVPALEQRSCSSWDSSAVGAGIRRILHIERAPNAPGRCLTVDSPSHLYVVKGGIVTHNTMSTILLAQELQKRGEIQHCLVICGLNVLKLNWKREVERFSDLSCTILGSKITSRGNLKIGSVAERAAHLNRPIDEFFVITNVESLRDDRVVDGILNGPNEFGLILVDEVHKCKGMSQQAQGLLKLTKASYKVAMTGTPIISSPLDAYVPLKWLGIERSTQTNFKSYYCTMDGPFGNMVTGYKNMEVLQETINKHSLRRTKEILNLPPKIHSVELVEMESTQASFYNDIKKGIKDQVDKVKLTTSSLLALLTRLRQATSCPSMLTTSDIPSAKIDRAVDLTEQLIASGEKVVIFSSFKEATAKLGELLKEHHPLVCTGDSSEEDIESAKTQFQQDDIHKVFIATWQKMGTGITLNRSSNVIFIDTPYTAADLEQAEDRCHRIGTKSTVNVYILVTAGTVDERVQEIVERKEALSNYLVDKQITEAGLDSLRKYIEEL